MYRVMEKLTPAPSGATKWEKTLADLLLIPFPPVTLLRPMKLFKGALGLKPGTTGAPDPDFLFHIVYGTGHQALLRAQYKDQYKNLENLLRGKARSSDTTLKNLQDVLGIKDLPKHAHGKKDGPLWPDLVESFQAAEGFYLLLASAVSTKEIPCPCCHQNMMNDVEAYWQRQLIPLDAINHAFLERLLTVTIGAQLIYSPLRNLSHSTTPFTTAIDMAEPRRHPIGNWLHMLARYYGCKDLSELPVRLPVDSNLPEGLTIPYGRIRKWASGQDPMAPVVANWMTKGASKEGELRALHLAARMIAFAIDFYMAAAAGNLEPKRELVQAIVHDRLVHLNQKIRFAARYFTSAKKLGPV